jgi:hypothetical protein
MIAAHLTLQPRLGQPPVTHHRGGRHVQHRSRLLHGQAAEKPHLDDAAFPLIESRQCLQGLVERDEVRSTLVSHDEPFVEGDPRRITAALLIAPRTRMIHENVPHHTSGDGEEVRAIVPCHGFRIDQPEIRLVDERRGLQAVIRPLVPDVPLRDSMELCVNERNQPLQGVVVALPPFQKQPGNLRGMVWNAISLGYFSAS